jgi:hypothetical protein
MTYVPSHAQVPEYRSEFGHNDLDRRDFNGGNDDSFYVTKDAGRRENVATGGTRTWVLNEAGNRIGTWHNGNAIAGYFHTGPHSLTFEEREDGAYLRTLTMVQGLVSCRFGSNKYLPTTTTTTTATTTENAGVIALQGQVAALASSVTPAMKEFVDAEMKLAMATMEAKSVYLNLVFSSPAWHQAQRVIK